MPLEYIRVFLMVNLTVKLLPASLGSLLIFRSIYSLSHFTTSGRRVGVIPGLFNITQETELSPVQRASPGEHRGTGTDLLFSSFGRPLWIPRRGSLGSSGDLRTSCPDIKQGWPEIETRDCQYLLFPSCTQEASDECSRFMYLWPRGHHFKGSTKASA